MCIRDSDSREWKDVNVAKPAALAYTLERQRDLAFLFRDLATLRSDIALFDSVDELQWKGPAEVSAISAQWTVGSGQ